MNNLIVTDAVNTWIAAAGMGAYLWYLWRLDILNTISKRSVFLFTTLFFLAFCRAFLWLSPNKLTLFCTFVPASLVPLAATLYIEGILRRHLPLFIKMYVAIGVFISLAMTFMGLFNTKGWPLTVFMLFDCSVFLILANFLLKRNRETLSSYENQYVDNLFFALVIIIPLLLTDFKTLISISPLRLGPTAMLVFSYLCMRNSQSIDSIRTFFLELFYAVAKSIALTMVFIISSNANWFEQSVYFFVPTLNLILLYLIFSQIGQHHRATKNIAFYDWLKTNSNKPYPVLLSSLDKLPLCRDAILVTETLLDTNTNHQLINYLNDKTLINKATLHKDLSLENNETAFIAGLCLDLLAKNEANNLCLLATTPLTLILLKLPPSPINSSINNEMLMVQAVFRRSTS